MRIFLKGKIISEKPSTVLDVFRRRYLEIEVEESRREFTNHYSTWKVLCKEDKGTKISKHFDVYKDLTIMIQGEAYNYYGQIPLVYADEIIIINEKNGRICH